jgi:extracellular matrix protein 14
MPPLSHLLLLAAVLPISFALPTDRSHTAANPLRRLQNAIFETIWTPPRRPSSRTQPEKPLPSNLRAKYGEFVVLRFTLSSQKELQAIELQDISKATERIFLDLWETTDQWVDLRVAKDMLHKLLEMLPPSLQHAHVPLMQDLTQTIYETYPYPEHSSQKCLSTDAHIVASEPGQGRELFFHEFQPLSVIYPWLRFMASAFPGHAEKISVGTSTEGREIAGIRLGSQPRSADDQARKTVLITGGSHAREWISVSTANYLAYSLMTRYGKYDGITKFLDRYDVVIIPTLNPDGYAYTWEEDRLWRKNRQNTSLPMCKGVDLDRAWGYEWDGATTKDNPCSETFAGDEAFSASESRHFAQWARNQSNNHNVQFVSFLDLHSYSQQILYPYSYSCEEIPRNLEDLQEVAMGLAKGFRITNNHQYSVSSACEGATTASMNSSEMQPRMDIGGGSALDWFYHELNVKFSYQIKLRDTGSYGFLLPKANIVPTGQEVFNGVLNLARFLLGNNGIESHQPASTQDTDDSIDWDSEYILPDGKMSHTDEIAVAEDLTVQDILGGHEDEEEEFENELRRRR